MASRGERPGADQSALPGEVNHHKKGSFAAPATGERNPAPSAVVSPEVTDVPRVGRLGRRALVSPLVVDSTDTSAMKAPEPATGEQHSNGEIERGVIDIPREGDSSALDYQKAANTSKPQKEKESIPETDPGIRRLAQMRDRGNARVKAAEARLNGDDILTKAEREKLEQEVTAGKAEATQGEHGLFSAGRTVAEHVARGLRRPHVNLEEVNSEAYAELMRTVKKFDPDRGQFFPYIVSSVGGGIRRAYRDRHYNGLIRPLRSVWDDWARAINAQAILDQENGGSHVSNEEIAKKSGLTPARVDAMLNDPKGKRPRSLDEPDETGDPIGDKIPDDSWPISDMVAERVTLAHALGKLPEREQRIIGLSFWRGMTQTQIAREVGLSQMHVSRLLRRSLDRLRTELENDEQGAGVQENEK